MLAGLPPEHLGACMAQQVQQASYKAVWITTTYHHPALLAACIGGLACTWLVGTFSEQLQRPLDAAAGMDVPPCFVLLTP